MCVRPQRELRHLQHLEEVGLALDGRSAIVRSRMGLEGVWSPVALTNGAHTSAVGRLPDYLGRDQWAWHGCQNHIAKVMIETSAYITTGVIRGPGRPGESNSA